MKKLFVLVFLMGCRAENPWEHHGYTDLKRQAPSFGECDKYSYTLNYEGVSSSGEVTDLGVCCHTWKDLFRPECNPVQQLVY